ncbi:hypothetical protein ACWGTI_09945 [Mesorhizobium sp. ArgA1]
MNVEIQTGYNIASKCSLGVGPLRLGRDEPDLHENIGANHGDARSKLTCASEQSRFQTSLDPNSTHLLSFLCRKPSIALVCEHVVVHD